MSKKPGLIRRFFRLLGGLLSAARSLINLIMVVLFVLVIASLFQKNVQPLPEKAALRVAPGGFLVEQKSYVDPIIQILDQSRPANAETLVHDLIKAIDMAAGDERITSLVLDLDFLIGGGISKLEDIGEALARFKTSGKPIIAVGDNYSQEQYYLASYADEIHLNPMGAVLLTGYGIYPNYLKDVLDKLKVHVNVFKVGIYKDAIEPFTRSNMSAASRQHTTEWLHSLWSAYTERVERLRELPTDAIDDYANNLGQKLVGQNGDTASLALAFGLVDKLSTRPQMLERLQKLAGKADQGGYQHIDSDRYLKYMGRAVAKAVSVKDKIGIIVAKGAILDGEQPDGSIGSDTLTTLFQQARSDNRIKALVLRVDSPGGSAFASEVIRQQMLITREKGIPVVVSMGSVAASGGYWIAMGADQIWANPTTITGSIGVFGIIPTFEDSLQALGIQSDGVGTTELSDLYQLNRPMSVQAKQVVQAGVDHVYDRFLTIVAKSRNSTVDQIHLVAQGRVWTGAKAYELGLVDELGSFDQAVVAAANLASLEDYEVEAITKPLDFREQLLQKVINSQSAISMAAMLKHWLPHSWLPSSVRSNLYSLSKKIELLVRFNDPRGMYLSCFECIDP